MNHANYRKLNDRTHSSSTYHKKDGTPVRAILRDVVLVAPGEYDSLPLEPILVSEVI